MILEEQRLNSGAEECGYCLLRLIDDRLSFDIEAGIEQHFTACDLSDLLQQSVKIRIVFFTDRLHASASIDVSDGWKRPAMRGPHIDGRDHVRQVHFGIHLKPYMSLFERNGGSE